MLSLRFFFVMCVGSALFEVTGNPARCPTTARPVSTLRRDADNRPQGRGLGPLPIVADPRGGADHREGTQDAQTSPSTPRGAGSTTGVAAEFPVPL